MTRVALITGGGSGIGRAIALALAAHQWRLCLAGRRVAALEQTVAAAGTSDLPPLLYGTDLSNEGEVRALAANTIREAGRLDLLVHSAGLIHLGPVETSSVADLDAQYQVNLRAPWLLTQLLLPALRAAQGQVVFINSTAGLDARATASQYAATKQGLRAVADALRAEVNRDGVRVTSVYVGRTCTPMQAAVHRLEGREFQPDRLLQPGDVAAAVVSVLDLPRTAEVTELTIRPMMPPAAGPEAT